MAVRRSGWPDRDHEWWLEERFGPPLTPIASLMGAKLHTGRTHQVRVTWPSWPAGGRDPLYGRKTEQHWTGGR